MSGITAYILFYLELFILLNSVLSLKNEATINDSLNMIIKKKTI